MQRRWMPLDVFGLEHLRGLRSPAIFAANHSSHLDTAMVYAALPASLRRRVAPAMSQDFFSALFNKGAPLFNRLQEALGYTLALALFNAYPLPRRLSGARRALHYSGELIDAGYSILIYPEGTRSETGEPLPFQPGVGLMARRLGVPVVPVRIEGLWGLFPPDASWPKSGRVRLTFGEPIVTRPQEAPESVAARVEQAVRALGSR